MKPKAYWTAGDIERVEIVFPELDGRIPADDTGGCSAALAADKLRSRGERELASLVERIARKGFCISQKEFLELLEKRERVTWKYQ